MNAWGLVILLALLPAAGNLAGALVAEMRQASPQVLNRALHAASGIVIAIVAVELVPEALGSLGGGWIALAFAAGGVAYVLLESRLTLEQGGGGGKRSRMWMIYGAVAIDLASDGLMIGTGSAVSSSLALALAAGQVLADVPEGYAAAASFRANGVPRRRRMLWSASFVVVAVLTALVSFWLLRNAPPAPRMGALVFAAGLLTVAAVEDMLEEAHEAHEDTRWSVLAFVGGFALFTLVSAGLGSIPKEP